MILFAMITRSHDGLPLSASTDIGGQISKEMTEARKMIKIALHGTGRLDDRYVLKLYPHFVYLITSFGLSYMALCEAGYPRVLAFSFLDEIQREFITVYDTQQVNNVKRPYVFIEFDRFVQKTRQRYNNPQSLTTRLNLPDLSLEIKLRPPTELNLSYLPQYNNNSHAVPNTGAKTSLPPLTWVALISAILGVFNILFNLFRGVNGLNESTIEGIDGIRPIHGLGFLTEAVLGWFQIYLLFYNMNRRRFLVWATFAFVVFINVYQSDVKDVWQILLHVGSSALVTASVIIRQPEPKMPKHNV